jgi:acetoin:2,6-dichlorophenolindophenol oxidoreductase subunit alpha
LSSNNRTVEPPSAAPSLDRETLRSLYTGMVEIRAFEDEVHRLFLQNLVRGTTHLYQGQEAVAVGACSALREGDTATGTYRGHGVVLAMGAPLDRAFAEILGRAGGLCGGKGGSMHLTDVSVGALGSFAIVGSHLPFACGSALSAQILKTGAISVAFFGDGTVNIGAFHEALNLAAIWALPVIFLCENNLYGEYSPLRTTTPIERLADRAAAYAMPGVQVDGNDVLAVRAQVESAAERARGGQGPTFIEALTYRHQGHSRTDPATYRPAGELEKWLERDPLTVFETVLVEEYELDPTSIEVMRQSAMDRVLAARDRALSWPEPGLEALSSDVFSVDSGRAETLDGRSTVDADVPGGSIDHRIRADNRTAPAGSLGRKEAETN